MSRDYKPRPERTSKQSQGNPFVTGLLIGFFTRRGRIFSGSDDD